MGQDPRFIIEWCMIYINPRDLPAISDSQEVDPLIRLQDNNLKIPWAWVCNNFIDVDDTQPQGTMRIRPMLPEEIEEHMARINPTPVGDK